MGMANRLSVASVKAASAPGRYADGNALYLLVGPSSGKSWLARVTRHGRQRDIGLGSASLVTLAQARDLCRTVRIQVRAGLDPIVERNKSRGVPTFREAAAKFIAENRATWRNAKHGAQWLSTLEAYAFPRLGDITLDQITIPTVREVLLEIWLEKPETARRVRQRIGAVLDWGFHAGHRSEQVKLPSGGKGKGLPAQRVAVKHHAAMPFGTVPAFITRMGERETTGRLALAALILTACRSGEIRGATWGEVDLAAGLWTIPGDRMKAGREHVVPLSPAAARIFQRAKHHQIGGTDLVFPGQARGKPLSDMSLTAICRKMKVDCVPHGFRSSFRDWVAEETNFPRELAEKALAHTLADKTERAYQRGTLLDKRRVMMDAWGAFCDGESASVVRLAVG
jgi:integrase